VYQTLLLAGQARFRFQNSPQVLDRVILVQLQGGNSMHGVSAAARG
jgi:hypothetical protein